MKNNLSKLALLTLPMLLSSCTMASIEINKPPVQPDDNSTTEHKSSQESNSEVTSEITSETSSTSQNNSSSSTSEPSSTSTSSKPPVEFDGLTFEEGKAIADNIINYIDNDPEYVCPTAFRKDVENISYKNVIEKTTVIDKSWINFPKYQYKTNHEEKSFTSSNNKPLITWTYKEPDKFNIINAKFENGVNSYKRLESSETMIETDFLTNVNGNPWLQLINEKMIMQETKAALTFVSSNKRMYDLAKTVSISSENEGSLTVDVATDINITGIGKLKELYLEVVNYNVVAYHIESVNNGLTSSITRVYDYATFSYDYPDLTKFQEEVEEPPTIPEDNSSSSSSETLNQ